MVQLDLNKIVCLTVLVIISLLGHSQNPVTLQFTGQDQYGQHVPLSTVTVENVTKHWQEVLYYPDTTLIMGTTGIEDGGWIGDGVRLFQNTPNPFDGVTDFALHLPEASTVTLEICDLNGNVAATYQGSLDPGSHLFRAWLASPQTYLLQARTSDGNVQIKMVNTGNGGQSRMEYLGKDDTHRAGKSGGDDKGSSDMPFSPGDWMMYKGYTHVEGIQYECTPVEQQQYTSGLIPLTFTLPQPPFYCGIDSVADYDGNVYPTVEIGNQCWMKENLRTTHYTDGTEIPVGTTISENTAYRYYPNNSSSNVPTYGYLYNWAAVMYGAASSNANPSGVQGICPLGWHVPSKAEFEQLMLFVSSQSQYLCDNNNIAKALATSFGWLGWSNDDYFCFPAYYTWLNNTTGFAAPPAGYWSGSSSAFGRDCTFWSSTSNDIYGNLSAFPFEVGNGVSINISDPTAYAHTVRCLLDDSWLTGNNAILPTITTKTIRDLSTSSASCGGQIYGSGGADVTNRGICWDTLPNPTVNNNHTSDGTGTGGYTSNMTNLMPNTTYYVRAYATNSVGTAYGEQRSFTTWDSLICDSTLTDYDGNIYHTVAIGQQCWMRENLRSTHFPDGTVIPLLTNAFSLPYRCVPNNDSTLIPTHGYLYNAYATQFGLPSNSGPIVVQGICPDGWHVPSTADWEQLIHFLRSRSEYCCWGDTDYIAQSLASNSGWEQNALPCSIGFDINANNASGFSALPAGSYNKTEGAVGINATTAFWHSTFNGNYTFLSIVSLVSTQRISPTIDEPSSQIAYEYQSGYSVRCLRDDSSAIVIPSVTTDTLRDIFFSSATCGGFVIESGSSTVSARGVCWSTSHNPTVNDSHTTNGSGTGSFTSHIDSLYANTTYYVRAYATNSAGTAYGEERSFTTLPTFYCGIDSVTDYDGNVYTTVEIGDQCWMKENLRTTHYADGTEILVGDPNSTYPTFPTTPYRCSPGNNNANVPVYGLLYNGYAACGSALTNFFQGVCPDGWHLPSQNEYEQLTSYVGNQSQYVCGGSSIAKSLASPSGWIGTSSNTCSVKYCPDENNATGFTAVPAGANGNSLGDSCLLWTRSLILLPGIYLKSIVVVDQTVCLNSFQPNKRFLSVRCLLNESWIDSADLVVPCVTTDTSSNILSTSATCGGFVSGSGGSSVTARGVCWSTSHNPTVNDSHTSEGSGTGRFSSNISGLATGTTYYVRAYATNSVGTAYGEERSFTTETSSVAPTQ